MCLLYTKKQVSELLGFSERTLYNRLAQIKFKKKTKGVLLTPDEVTFIADKLGIKVTLQKSA